jgi:hypothetical protein
MFQQGMWETKIKIILEEKKERKEMTEKRKDKTRRLNFIHA